MKNIKAAVTKAINANVNALGYRIERLSSPPELHYLEEDPHYREIIKAVKPFTITPIEKIAAMVDAARYVERMQVPGAIVECGVWRGGSTMAAALALRELKDFRDLYLLDTFAGMTTPTENDIDYSGTPAASRYAEFAAIDHNEWCYASLEDVRANIASTEYPADKCHFVKGDVLETFPSCGPDQIAILRLDTDWYELTLHELRHLYPRLSPGGVLIIDDYGYWQGCQKAVDEYFAERGPFLGRIDSTGKIAIKR